MGIVFSLKKEHKEMYKKLDMLERSINKKIDYLRLSKLFRDFQNLWNTHEEAEEFVFHVFVKDKRAIEKMSFDHKSLRGHRKVLNDFIASGNEHKIRVALDTDGRMLIDKLKRHMKEEDKIFERITQK